MDLFKHIGSYQRDNTSDFPPTISTEIYFSDFLQMYIEIYGDDYTMLKPIQNLKDIQDYEADKIRRQLGLLPTDEITYFHLFIAGYTNLFLLEGPQSNGPKDMKTSKEISDEVLRNINIITDTYRKGMDI
jgi:hypothetical protein